MEEDFLIKRLEKNGIKAIVPSKTEEIVEIDRIIFDELCKGEVKISSKEYYIQVVEKIIQENKIEGVILGCTEIEMLIKQSDLSIPIFDTTQSHIDAIVEEVLKN